MDELAIYAMEDLYYTYTKPAASNAYTRQHPATRAYRTNNISLKLGRSICQPRNPMAFFLTIHHSTGLNLLTKSIPKLINRVHILVALSNKAHPASSLISLFPCDTSAAEYTISHTLIGDVLYNRQVAD